MRIEYIRLALTAALAVVLGIAWWQQSEPQRILEQETSPGRLLFVGTGCGGCHVHGDNTPSMAIGPPLSGLAERARERVPGMTAAEYIEQSIREPQAFTVSGFEAGVMPTFPLSDEDVSSLVDYLLTST